MEMHYIMAKGIKVGYLTRGTGPRNLLLMHGNFCPVYFWEGLMHALPEDRYRVVAIDYWVESGRPWGGYTASGFADLMRDAMDALGMKRAVVGGHSMGGLVSLIFALRFPERVEKLIVMGSGATVEGHRKLQEFVDLVSQGNLNRDVVTQIHRAFWSTNPSNESIRPHIDYLMRAPKEVMRDSIMSVSAYDLRPQLSYIDIPTLICHGTLDSGRTMDHVRQLQKGIPKSQVALFETGHLMMLEDPSGFNQRVQQFLDEN